MTDRGPVERPTYGAVRRSLAERGLESSIAPGVSDEEPLPDFPLGALAPGEDEVLARAALDPETDIRELIAQLPPNDPELRRVWEEAGVSLDRTPDPTSGDRPDVAPEQGDDHGAAS